jgi:dipeptidyl aminopeptidase B
MASNSHYDADETRPLTRDTDIELENSTPRDSVSSISTTSLVLEHVNDPSFKQGYRDDGYANRYANDKHKPSNFAEDDDYLPDEELGSSYHRPTAVDRKAKRLLWIVGMVAFAGWVLAAVLFTIQGNYKPAHATPHDPQATVSRGSGKTITLDDVLGGQWSPRRHSISWIAGPEGEDGLLLERGESGKEYLVVEDVRDRKSRQAASRKRILMNKNGFSINGKYILPANAWPSADLRKVLVLSDRQSNWRHSFTGKYWIFDVNTQTGEPLDPDHPDDRVQLATWSPQSNAVVFTRDNNMYLRKLDSKTVTPITTDGGPEFFYGIPDWVYEEEVFGGNSATWWSQDGDYIAFLSTNETAVPTYPVQYFLSRPSGKDPLPGEESYPEVRNIKYPKAGAPNPVVEIQFYDVNKGEIFHVPIAGDFPDDDRLITEVVWAGNEGKVIVRETNRESDVLKVILMDVTRRQGQTVREDDVAALDGGWFEVSEETTYIPSDPAKGRLHAGYIDTVIHDGYDHLAYFTPLENPEPVLLTSGNWEVVKAPSAVDLENNYVYFSATKESSIQRHVYRVKLDGTSLEAVTDVSNEGFYDVSFSAGAGYALVSYDGPNIPWQKVVSTPSNPESYEDTIESNPSLKDAAAKHEMPIEIYSTINIDGFDLNVVERRPPHFSEKKKYPVLFFMYQGPGSQSVDKRFKVDFQSYVAANLGYIVVTVDGRGTGFRGRKTRCIVRGNIGHYESHDQIEAAKVWAKKRYVDEERMAIWGWSYGGFMTLKVLEQDAGRTFKYGMAVAPVTDWRFYDSIYTERYMHTPQHNPGGYDNSSISDVKALSENVRFLVMHGVADDNVHTQSTYVLLDKLDVAGVENYDVHVFPDSDHGIYFHNANRIVWDSKFVYFDAVWGES